MLELIAKTNGHGATDEARAFRIGETPPPGLLVLLGRLAPGVLRRAEPFEDGLCPQEAGRYRDRADAAGRPLLGYGVGESL